MTTDNTYADAYLSINLASVVDNYTLIRGTAQEIECFPVVKADAYGLGADKVAPALVKAGCKCFFVATVDEGIALRHLLPNVSIYVFHGPNNQTKEAFRVYKMVPVINSLEQFHLWNEYAIDLASTLPAFLHVDTGMNRLGLSTEELKKNVNIIRQAENIKWLYLMSHLACADIPGHPMNQGQLDKFQQSRKLFPFIKGCFANSSGTFLGREFQFHATRPGSALYGINPTPHKQNPMKPVVTLKGKILQIRTISSQETISYGGTCTVDAGSRIAVVPVGYADGYLRSLSNHPNIVSIAGHRASVVGVVTMDSIMIDVTHLPQELCKIGDEVTLVGGDISLEEVAQAAGTIPYEILTSLGQRYRREYTGMKAKQQNILTGA